METVHYNLHTNIISRFISTMNDDIENGFLIKNDNELYKFLDDVLCSEYYVIYAINLDFIIYTELLL